MIRFSTWNSRRLFVLLAASIAISLLARLYESFPGDISLILWVQTWQHPVIRALMEAVSVIGKSIFMLGLAGAVTLGLFLAGRRSECLAAVGVLMILTLTPILQQIVYRSRPSADIVGSNAHLSGLSFPSGHAFQSFVLFGFLIYLATILIRKMWLRRFAQAFLVALILAIGVSRVYLGAHWPSDILGSYLLGGSLLALLLRGYQTRSPVAAS